MACDPVFSKVLCIIGVAGLLAACAEAHELVSFGYQGFSGPQNWGSLSPAYALCSKGTRQSPIAIVKEEAVVNPSLKRLCRDYRDAKATLINNGVDILLRYDEDVGASVIDGKNYTLKQMLWRTPSEHTLDGIRYPVELQLVHAGDDGSISVIAILYQYGHPDPFLYQLKEKVEELSKQACGGNAEAHVPVGVVVVKPLRRHARRYFRYVGSLTAPPCTENVIWTVLDKVRQISEEQIGALRSMVGEEWRNNSRPLQPLNGRQVHMFYE